MLLFDGSRTTLLETTLPVRDLATARRAAPYAVEEQLASPLEQTQLATASLGNKRYAIAAVDRAELDAISQQIRHHGLEPTWVVPECCAVPWEENGWSIVVDDDWAVVRTAACSGIKLSFECLAEIVPQLREQFPQTARVEIYTNRAPDEFPSAVFAGLDLTFHGPLSAALMIATLERQQAPLLLDASARAGQHRLARRLWRATASTALLLAIAYPAFLAWGNASLARTEASLKRGNQTLFTTIFPEITRVVDPRVQAEQAVAQLRGRQETAPRFLDLLAKFDRAYKPVGNEKTGIRAVAFASGTLEIGIDVADMAALEQTRGALQTAALAVDILSAESSDSGVIARLRIRETP